MFMNQTLAFFNLQDKQEKLKTYDHQGVLLTLTDLF